MAMPRLVLRRLPSTTLGGWPLILTTRYPAKTYEYGISDWFLTLLMAPTTLTMVTHSNAIPINTAAAAEGKPTSGLHAHHE